MTTATKSPAEMTIEEILEEFGWQTHAPWGTPESTPRREALRAELAHRRRVLDRQRAVSEGRMPR